jgi:hypothetical protein
MTISDENDNSGICIYGPLMSTFSVLPRREASFSLSLWERAVVRGFLVAEYGMLVAEYGMLVAEYGMLVAEYGMLVAEYGMLVAEYGMLVAEYGMLNTGCWIVFTDN